MKEIKKDFNNHFVCEECGKTFIICNNFSRHIRISHMSIKEYFDKWLKEEGDGLCKCCGKETTFLKKFKGYRKTCSKECKIKIWTTTGKTEKTLERRKETCIKLFGVECYAQTEEFALGLKNIYENKSKEEKQKIKEKREITNLEKYGTKYVVQTEECKIKIKQTKLERYGNEKYVNVDKMKQTKLERYGDENYVNMAKIKQINLERYGVECTLQNKEIREKSEQTKLEKYGDKNFNNREKYVNTCLEKYNEINVSRVKEIKEKKKETCLKNYGVESPIQSNIIQNIIKETNLNKYGVENVFQNEDIKNKIKNTNLERYGVECTLQNKEIREKSKNTMLERYGVEYPTQNIDILNKALKSLFYIHKFKETNITYQGSYELDFLNKYYDILDIENGPVVLYTLDGKEHFYFSDFYIKSINLVVEIKSTRTLELQSENELIAKRNSIINNNYNFIMILNKNYEEFEHIINE